MIIRYAIDEDIPVLISFNSAMALETENIRLNQETVGKGIQAVLNDPTKGFYLLAEMNGKPVGQLLITKEWSDWRNRFFWWIQSVYIKPEFRNRGIYRALHEKVVHLAKSDNVCGIRLYVDKENMNAQKVYKKMGMSESNYTLFEKNWLCTVGKSEI